LTNANNYLQNLHNIFWNLAKKEQQTAAAGRTATRGDWMP